MSISEVISSKVDDAFAAHQRRRQETEAIKRTRAASLQVFLQPAIAGLLSDAKDEINGAMAADDANDIILAADRARKLLESVIRLAGEVGACTR